MSKIMDCQNRLVNMAEKVGYITERDVLDLYGSYNLSLQEIDMLTESLQAQGILVYESRTRGKVELNEDLMDYTRTDYESIYTELLNMSESLRPLVEDVRNCPPPQHGEIRRLVKQMHEGNSYARDRLISSHLRMVLKIALSTAKKYELDIEDAVGAGFEGLITAVDKYELDGASAFSSYASLWIIQYIHRLCRAEWIDYYVPIHVQEKMAGVYLSCLSHAGTFDEAVLTDPELQREIAEDLGMTIPEVSRVLKLCCMQKFGKISMEDVSEKESEEFENPDQDAGEESMNAGSCFACDDSGIAAGAEREERTAQIERALSLLSPREAEVLKMRFGFRNDHGMTLEEVGKHFGVTRERIRQIQRDAFKTLNRSGCADSLRDFLN